MASSRCSASKETGRKTERQGLKIVSYNSKIHPTESFPANLRELDDSSLHALNSKVHRELDVEYLCGGPEPETEFRREELTEELDRRESNEQSRPMSGSHLTLVSAV